MGIVIVVEVPHLVQALRGRGERVLETPASVGLEPVLRALGDDADAVVIGADVGDPVQSAQHAYRFDPSVAVVLLGKGAQCMRLADALRFLPFIGSDVACEDVSNPDLAASIESAAERTRARRRQRATLAALDAQLLRSQSRPAAVRVGDVFAAQLLDVAPIGIVSLDGERRVIAANVEATRLLGSSEREMIGGRLGRDVGSNGPAWDELLDRARTERATATFDRSDGLRGAVEASSVALRAADGFVIVLQDVSERLRAADARELALRSAEEANRLKDNFVAMISHELRTPLNAVVGWVRVLRNGKLRAERSRHALDVIERNAQAQVRLVEDLLDMSRTATGKLRLDVRPTHLGHVLRQAADSVRVAAAAKQLSVVMDIEEGLPELNADAERLQQVFWNVLSNAVKFSPRHGTVRVQARRRNSIVEVAIMDDGQGISAEELPYVFEPFRQTQAGGTRAHGGLGLGLAIVRRLVERHGGQVTANSEGIGRGATFKIELPIVPLRIEATDQSDVIGAARTALAARTFDQSLSAATVLIVDDDRDTRELLAILVESVGGRACTAASSDEAIAVLARERIDIVVSDIGMRGMDGYAFVERVRKTEGAARSVPIIALTAHARDQDRARALAAGFDAHASKPIAPTDLVHLMANLREAASEARRASGASR